MSQASFAHPLVRDLVAVVASPGLLEPSLRPEIFADLECGAWLERHEAELRALDQDPAPLLSWLDARLASPLLGRYFEALVGFWITRLMRARRFEPSIVISTGKNARTLGELDFVFEDRRRFALALGSGGQILSRAKLGAPVDAGSRTDGFLGGDDPGSAGQETPRSFLTGSWGCRIRPRGAKALTSGRVLRPPRSRLMMKGMLFYPAAHGVQF